MRSLPDLNRSSRFCRPVPSPSAKRPFVSKAIAKVRSFSQLAKYFLLFLCEALTIKQILFPLSLIFSLQKYLIDILFAKNRAMEKSIFLMMDYRFRYFISRPSMSPYCMALAILALDLFTISSLRDSSFWRS